MNRFDYMACFIRPKIFTPLLANDRILRDKRTGELVKCVKKGNGDFWHFGSWYPEGPVLGPIYLVACSVAGDNYESI